MKILFPAVLASLALTSGGAIAQTAERCSLVGQMAGSVWLEMIQGLGDGKTAQVDSAIARLDCDQAALNTAFDCVLTAEDGQAPRAVLRQCMAQSGIAGE